MPKPDHARPPGPRAERSELVRLVWRIQAPTLQVQERRRRELDHADVEAKERLLEQLSWQLVAVGAFHVIPHLVRSIVVVRERP